MSKCHQLRWFFDQELCLVSKNSTNVNILSLSHFHRQASRQTSVRTDTGRTSLTSSDPYLSTNIGCYKHLPSYNSDINASSYFPSTQFLCSAKVIQQSFNGTVGNCCSKTSFMMDSKHNSGSKLIYCSQKLDRKKFDKYC